MKPRGSHFSRHWSGLCTMVLGPIMATTSTYIPGLPIQLSRCTKLLIDLSQGRLRESSHAFRIMSMLLCLRYSWLFSDDIGPGSEHKLLHGPGGKQEAVIFSCISTVFSSPGPPFCNELKTLKSSRVRALSNTDHQNSAPSAQSPCV